MTEKNKPEAIDPGSQEAGVSDIAKPQEQPVDQLPHRREMPIPKQEEQVRGWIAAWTIAILFTTILLSFLGVFVGRWDDVRGLLMVIMPLEATLIGGIAGYYLGANRNP